MAKKSLKIEAIFKGIDRITRPVNRMQSRLRRFSKSAKRSLRAVDRVATKVGRTMVRGVAAGFRAATVAAVAFGVATANIIRVGAGFERTLVTAATKFPGRIEKGTEAFKKLEMAARKTGKTTEFTGVQSAEGLKLLGAAGFDVAPAIAALSDVVRFAIVAETDLAESVTMSVGVLDSFGLASDNVAENQKQLVRVMDVMKFASDSAAQTVQDVSESMAKAGKTAVTYNQDIEDVGAAMIVLARANIKNTEAGTAYRNIMIRLANPVGRAAKIVKELGIEIEDSKGNMLGFSTLMGQFTKKLEKLGTRQRGVVLDVVFGKKAIDAASTVIKKGSAIFEDLGDKGRAAAGTIAWASKQIQDTTTGSFKSFLSAVEAVKISLFNLENVRIKGVIDRITEWTRVNEKLIVSKVGAFLEYIEKNFDKIVQTLKNLAAVTGSLFALIGAIKALKGTMDFVDLLKSMDLKLVAIMVVVTALAVAAGFVIANWDAAKASFNRIWSDIKETFRSALDFIVHTGPISWLIFAVGLIKEAWGAVAPFFAGVFDVVSYHFNRFVNAIIKSGPIVWILKTVDRIKEKWGELKVFFKELWEGIGVIFKVAVAKIREELGPLIDILEEFFAFKKFLIDKFLSEGSFGHGSTSKDPMDLLAERIATRELANLAETPDLVTRIKQPIGGSFYEENMSMLQGRVSGEAEAPRMVSPQDPGRSVSESTTTEKKLAEVTIRDETGRAEVTQGDLALMGFQMLKTGSF